MNLFAALMSKMGKKNFDPDVQALAELTGAALLNEQEARKTLEEALSKRVAALEGRLPIGGLESTSDPRFDAE